MTSTSNEMFKILSLRRSLSLGKEPKGPDEADRTRRQRIIDAQRKEGLAIVDGRTKLQDAKQKRDAHLKQIKDVEAIRNRFAALYADRRKDAYKK